MSSDKKLQAKKREELMQFVYDKSFVYGPSPEIYDGGVSGFYDFGPLGKLLKNNVEGTIKKVFNRFQFYDVECPIVMPKKVWEASGHLGGFSDPLVKCTKCQAIWRVDSIIEEQYSDIDAENMSVEEMSKFLTENEVKCASCKAKLPGTVKQHDLMLKTGVGIDIEMYNRPETATTTYLPFLNYLRFFRDKLPFGVYQIGNAYRNEISPRQHLIRGREFTQAEAQLFLFKDQKENFERFDEVKDLELPFLTADAQKNGGDVVTMSLAEAMEKKVLKNKAYAWTLGITYQMFRELGFPHERLRYNQHLPEKLAFYADDAWDLEVKFNSYGWIESCGCHDRTDYDLTTHSKHSGKELMARNPVNNEKETPHILEIAIGPNRVLLGVLDLFYEKNEADAGKTKLKIPNNLAPIKAAIFPLMKKEPLQKVANEIFRDLIGDYVVQIDESGSIGKRYLRQDSIGTPFCITVDYETLEEGENKDTVTVRSRDSEEQVRIRVSELQDWLRERL